MRQKTKPSKAWLRRAEKLNLAIPLDRLHPAVRAWSLERRGAARGSWCVAFSGGADSLALLLLVRTLSRELPKPPKILVLHFNHRLRGRAADADEKFCQRVCEALGLQLATGRWSRRPRPTSEAEARAARFTFFEEQMRRTRSQALWLGHHQDDIAETILMRLARGSGTAGLAAPRPIHSMLGGRVHLRPLLTLKKAEIKEALRTVGIPWREDATNESKDYFRNRVRKAVIPVWRQAAGDRDAVAGAALSRELLEEDDSALEAWLDELAPLKAEGMLDLGRLLGKPAAVWRRALHRWLVTEPRAGQLSRQGFTTLLIALQRGKSTRHSVGSEGFAVVRGGKLRFEPILLGMRAGK